MKAQNGTIRPPLPSWTSCPSLTRSAEEFTKTALDLTGVLALYHTRNKGRCKSPSWAAPLHLIDGKMVHQ